VITGRELLRGEIERIWTIDRSEVIDNIYYFENGTLVLRQEHYDMPGWPPGEAEKYTPILVECFDRGGWFYGLFDDESLIGVAVLAREFIGKKQDQLQLKFLHVSNAYRKRGLGKRLYELAKVKARELGAKQMYISATPSENTVKFYQRRGCRMAQEPDPELFKLEPEDIHLECDV
jgi:predicted N-acetyltransferase YhbS